MGERSGGRDARGEVVVSGVARQGRRQTVLRYGGVAFILTLLATGCTQRAADLPELEPMRAASRAPGQPWQPRAGETAPALRGEQPPGLPDDLTAQADRLTLAQLVDAALRESPSTRVAWQTARAAAATYGQARGAYYPTVVATADVAYERLTGPQGAFSGGFAQIGASLGYLLLDFGGRDASVEAARQALFAANWNQNQAIQDVLLNVAQAYYAYIGAKAQVRAAESNLHDAEISLKAADARLQYGAGTIADVYQARADAAQATFVLVGTRGAVETARGVLATAVGWRADASFDVGAAPPAPPLRDVEHAVERLIATAQQQRPALAAARADVLRRQAALRQAESALWPTLNANGAVQPQWAQAQGGHDQEDVNYAAGLQVTAPIFEGFALRNAVRSARATLAATRAQLELSEQQVIDDVWTAYYAFRTAAEQLDASRALLASAKESYDVSFERYRLGAGDIVQLLNTQSTLAGARATLVNAETALYTTYALLLHAIGAADPSAFGSGPAS
jgi:TolC family type I secretion outer membrane protein